MLTQPPGALQQPLVCSVRRQHVIACQCAHLTNCLRTLHRQERNAPSTARQPGPGVPCCHPSHPGAAPGRLLPCHPALHLRLQAFSPVAARQAPWRPPAWPPSEKQTPCTPQMPARPITPHHSTAADVLHPRRHIRTAQQLTLNMLEPLMQKPTCMCCTALPDRAMSCTYSLRVKPRLAVGT